MNQHQPHQKPRSRANWITQIVLGIFLTLAGLLIGFSIPKNLSIQASIQDQHLVLKLETDSLWSPFGQVEFWTSVDGSKWQLQSTDKFGFDGWASSDKISFADVLHVRIIMKNMLGQTHEVKDTFFNSALFDQETDETLVNLEASFQFLIDSLATGDFQTRQQVATWIKNTNNPSFLPYLIEILQFHQNENIQEALEFISGQTFSGGRALRQWYEWLWTQPVDWNDSFFTWKRTLFASKVPSMQALLSNQGTLDWRFVVWGGIPPGGIPPLNEPRTIPAMDADFFQPNDIIFGASIHGQARAYPIRMMDWHELANDELGGEFIALSYCPLCGSAVLFNRRVGETIYTFNTSGLLYQSNKLMFDEQTMSLWPNIAGQPLAGPLADDAIVLQRYPLTTTTWKNWVELHPDTDVIDPSGSNFFTYETHEAYDLYRVSTSTLAPASPRDERLAEKDWVFGISLNENTIAYPIQQLETRQVWNDQLKQQSIVLLVDSFPGSQFGFYPATVRAFERQNFEFDRMDDTLTDQHGTPWTITEDALVSASGERLKRIYGETMYWFAWHTFHPATDLKNMQPVP